MPTATEKQREALRTIAPKVADADSIIERFVVHVRGPRDSSDADAVVTTHVLLNLLPRVFTHIHYDGTPDALNFPESHKARIRKDAPARADLTISTRSEHDDSQVFVASRGWVAHVSTDSPWTEPRLARNGIAATYAAALAVADAFNRAFFSRIERATPIDGTYRYDISTLATSRDGNYEPDVSQLHTEDAVLVGVGAVGQAFLAALSSLPRITGDIRLVEHDSSDEGNEQRCLFAFLENRGTPKALLVQQTLQQRQPYFRVDIPHAAVNVMFDYGGFRLATRGRSAEKLVVTALDQEQARRDVQAGLHRTILNGWTETNQNQLAYGISCHEIGRNGCLTCFHPPRRTTPSEAEFAANRTGLSQKECEMRLLDPTIHTTADEVRAVAERLRIDPARLAPTIGRPFIELIHGTCGVATMDVQGEPIVASVTHVPTLVGSLLAAQFVLHELGRPSLEHLAIYDAFRPPTDDQLERRDASLSCYCQNEVVRRTYEAQWKSTR